jgi:hypothetical protein
MFLKRRDPNYYTKHTKNDEVNGNIEFLQPHPVVAAD